MRIATALVAGLLALPSGVVGADIPGWIPGSIALAGEAVIATQSGAVTSGSLRYFRTDAWRVSTRDGERGVMRERIVAVRTSAGPMRVAPIAARADGVFVMAAPLVHAAGPVIRCCDPATGLQDVLESDGRPGARIPVAVGITASSVTWVTTSINGTVAVRAAAGDAAVETPITSDRPEQGLIAVDGDTVSWVAGPLYDGDALLKQASLAQPARAPMSHSLAPAFRPTALVAGGGTVAITAGDANGRTNVLSVRDGKLTRVWEGADAHPIVAAGGGRVVIASGRDVYLSRDGAPLRRIRIDAVRIRSIAVDRTRIAWTSWMLRRGVRVTTVRWARA